MGIDFDSPRHGHDHDLRSAQLFKPNGDRDDRCAGNDGVLKQHDAATFNEMSIAIK